MPVIAKSSPMEGFPYNILFLIPFKDEIIAWAAPKMVVNPAMLAGPAEIARIHQITSTFSEDRCRRLAADFVADGTWQVPTLIRLKTSELADASEFNNDRNLRYMSKESLGPDLHPGAQLISLPRGKPPRACIGAWVRPPRFRQRTSPLAQVSDCARFSYASHYVTCAA
jgi:hypothetical protein